MMVVLAAAGPVVVMKRMMVMIMTEERKEQTWFCKNQALACIMSYLLRSHGHYSCTRTHLLVRDIPFLQQASEASTHQYFLFPHVTRNTKLEHQAHSAF